MNAFGEQTPPQPRRLWLHYGSRCGALLAMVATLTATMAIAARAEGNWEIDGVYRVTSNGEWATRNDVYQDVPTVVATWTVETTCTGPEQCTGEVTSDQGWSAPITNGNGLWYVRRTIEGWQQCPDGSSSQGKQTYTFYPVDAGGQVSSGSPIFAGLDTTIGVSGACGVNQWLAIRLPLKLVKLA